MDMISLCLLIAAGLCSVPAKCSSHQFHFIEQAKSWSEAQAYCRREFTDLATIENVADLGHLAYFSGFTESAWIGLERGDASNWHWSLPEKPFIEAGAMPEYQDWGSGGSTGGQPCVMMRTDSVPGWFTVACTETRSFVCYDVRGEEKRETEMYIRYPKSGTDPLGWTDAQTFCRERHTDLASVRSEDENLEVQRAGNGTSVWIGLFKDTWRWSDRSNASFRHWAADEPGILGSRNCVLVQPTGHRWATSSCGILRPFFCREEAERTPVAERTPEAEGRQVMRLQLTVDSKKDLNNPEIQAAILEKLHERVRGAVVPGGQFSLQWSKQPDGKVFHKKKTTTRRKTRRDLHEL